MGGKALQQYDRQTPSGRSDLLSFMEELERSVEEMTASLDRLRETVQLVALQVREYEEAPSAALNATPVLSVVEHPETDAAILEVQQAAERWQSANLIEETTASPPQAEVPAGLEAAADDAAREEVRRAVEATRAQMSWSNLRVDSGFNMTPDMIPGAEPSEEQPPEALSSRAQETVAPAQPVTSLADEPPTAIERPSTFVDDEARREEVRLAVERAREDMHRDDRPVLDEDDRRREEVRRAVESARSSLSWSDMKADAGTWGQFQPEPGGFKIGPEQAPARVGNASENLPEQPPEATAGLDPEETRREEVRRAVEAARAEMFQDAAPEPPRIVPLVPKPGSPAPKGADFSGPPIIVIEDASGRVELSQVFATLSRVDRSSQAALLNYSPHSVTIGLNVLATVPDLDDLREAAQAVFGRSCSVKSEGGRTAIQIGNA